MQTATPSQAPQTVFLNSAYADNTNDTMNGLNFNLKRPLFREEGDIVYCSLSKFESKNIFFNISQAQQNNIIKVLNVMYNANTQTYFNIIKIVTIPDGRYDESSLLVYLNPLLAYTQATSGANWTSTNGGGSNLFLGFGFSGTNGSFTETAIPGMVVSTPDYGVMAINAAGTGSTGNIYSKTYVSGSYSTDAYIYTGVYFIADESTIGFLNDMGLQSRYGTLPPPIQNSGGYKGFGFTFPSLSATPSPTMPLTASTIFDLGGPSNLTIVIPELGVSSLTNSSYLDGKPILGSALVTVPYQWQFSYQQTYQNYQAMTGLNSALNNLSVFIYDQESHLVDFRGEPWTMEINFMTLSNAKDDTLHKATANINSTLGPYTGVTNVNSHLESNPYGGTSMIGSLHHHHKRPRPDLNHYSNI